MSRLAALPLLVGALGGIAITRERQSRRSLERFAAAALETLLNAIDANDADTGAHVRRVAAMSLVLAEEAALDPHAQRSVERVALFHDVGKIHAALFDIIHDDTKLTPAERRAIATHPARGAGVLAPLARFYPDLAEGVLSHHERWDGTGYPCRIRGARIPLSSRIVAIADTFDVVSHGRRYRRRRSDSLAAEVIASGRGTQFDPALVDLFLFPPVFQRVLATRDRLPLQKSRRSDHERRTGKDEPTTPDVPFRWRRPVARSAGTEASAR